MTFKQYRTREANWRDKLSLKIIDGKNFRKEVYTVADFDEDTEYELDDFEVIEAEVNNAMLIHYLTVRR